MLLERTRRRRVKVLSIKVLNPPTWVITDEHLLRPINIIYDGWDKSKLYVKNLKSTKWKGIYKY